MNILHVNHPSAWSSLNIMVGFITIIHPPTHLSTHPNTYPPPKIIVETFSIQGADLASSLQKHELKNKAYCALELNTKKKLEDSLSKCYQFIFFLKHLFSKGNHFCLLLAGNAPSDLLLG